MTGVVRLEPAALPGREGDGPPVRRAVAKPVRLLNARDHTVGTEGGFLKMSWTPGMGGLRVRNGPQVSLEQSV